MAGVRFEDLSKTFPGRGSGDPVEVIRQLNLTINDGEFLVLVGPSGCGKSTLLRLLAGLDSPTSGEIRIGSRPISDVPPARRNVAMVFQSYALYPHLSVRDNLSFGLRRSQARSTFQRIQDQAFQATRALPKPLRVRSVREERIEARVNTVARSLELTELLDRRPKELSGGQKQRVALGRAMARNPEVFLMDEPLSNLDAKLRTSTRQRIVELQRELGTTTVYVTHDQVEAMTMADKIVVLQAGVIEQVGSPLDLYRAPRNIFVAGFIGSPTMNFLTGEEAAKRGAHTVGIRPEHVSISTSDGAWKGTVGVSEHLGSDTFLHVHREAGGPAMTVRVDGEFAARHGDTVWLTPQEEHVHKFDAEGLRIA